MTTYPDTSEYRKHVAQPPKGEDFSIFALAAIPATVFLALAVAASFVVTGTPFGLFH